MLQSVNTIHVDGPLFPETKINKKQGRIYDNPVTDGWAEAVGRKPLGIQKMLWTDRRVDRPTRQGVESRVRD